MIQRLTNKRVAMISGWAVEPNAVYRYQVDAAFRSPITPITMTCGATSSWCNQSAS